MKDEISEESRIPWTGEFSPGQLGDHALVEALQIVASAAGDRAAIVEGIRQRWFQDAAASRDDPDERLEQQQKRSGNVLIGMQRYGLIDRSCRLSELGHALLDAPDDQARNAAFGTFLLRHRHGMELLQIVRDMQRRGTLIKNDTLRDELRRRGYAVATNSGDAGKLRQWLETAGIITKRWKIDEERVAALTGLPTAAVEEWRSLDQSQQAFLRTIRRLSETRGQRPVPSPELLDFVREEHGPVFNEGQVRRIYAALASGGWVDHTVKAGGRGGKGGFIAATSKLIQTDFELLLGFAAPELPGDLRAAMTKPLSEIRQDLLSTDTYVKGVALELVAVNLASDLGLTPVSLRVRGVRTGGAEVDLVAEGAHLHFSRWLFQCKNTRSVDVGVLAKEIGMATLLNAHVIVIATTGTFSSTVQAYARRVGETTPFQVILVDGRALEAYWLGGAMAVRGQFHEQAAVALQLKRPQILATLHDLVEEGTAP